MCRGIKRYEDIPAEEVADIALVGDEFPPGTYMSFTPTFKYLGTVISWDLREGKDIEARIKSANKLFGSAKATFWSNSRVPFDLRMGFYKAIIINVLLWGCESWAIQSKEVQALRVDFNTAREQSRRSGSGGLKWHINVDGKDDGNGGDDDGHITST